MPTWRNSHPSRQQWPDKVNTDTILKSPGQHSCHCRAVASHYLSFKLALTFSPFTERALFSHIRSHADRPTWDGADLGFNSAPPRRSVRSFRTHAHEFNQTLGDDETSDGWNAIFLTAAVSLQSSTQRLSKWAWPFSLSFILKSNENNIHNTATCSLEGYDLWTFVNICKSVCQKDPIFSADCRPCLKCHAFQNTRS